jgi:hypothetical protein
MRALIVALAPSVVVAVHRRMIRRLPSTVAPAVGSASSSTIFTVYVPREVTRPAAGMSMLLLRV